jgi:hypothetical protein
MVYEDIMHAVEEKVRSGEHVISHPRLGLDSMDFRAERISVVGDYVRFASGMREVFPVLGEATNGYGSLRRFLSGLEFSNPVLTVTLPQRIQDVHVPKLEGLADDNRVQVRVVNHVGKRFRVYGTVDFGLGHEISRGIDYFHPFTPDSGRDYQVMPNPGGMEPFSLNVFRHPVIVSAGLKDKVERRAGLAYRILCDELEPWTTRHIENQMDCLSVCGHEPTEQDFDEIKRQALFEERFLAKTLVRAWLASEMQDNGFNMGDIIDWRANKSAPLDRHEYQALQHVQRDIGRVIDFYRSDFWDYDNLINGAFRE